jgi:hypothetical protein
VAIARDADDIAGLAVMDERLAMARARRLRNAALGVGPGDDLHGWPPSAMQVLSASRAVLKGPARARRRATT